MLMHLWNHLQCTPDQPLRGQSKYSLYVGKRNAGLLKRFPCECINYAARLCTSSTMDSLKSFAVRAWLRFGAEGTDSTGASLGAFVRNGSTQNKLLEIYKHKYMGTIYIVGGIVPSISYQRLKSFETWHCAFPRIVDFLWIKISLFFHGICKRHSFSWGFVVTTGSILTYSF